MSATRDESTGSLRYKADLRQYGGLTFVVSSLITVFSLTDIADLSAGGGNTPDSGLPLYNLVAACFLATAGTIGMALGYNVLVRDSTDNRLSAAAIVTTQLTWIPFIGGLTATGLMTAQEFDPNNPSFIPASLSPTNADVKFVGAMGILSIMAYAASFVGSMGFMQFAIYAYQKGHAADRSAPYFRGRALYYNCTLLLAGATQFLLGAYSIHHFGSGPYQNPIVLPLYTVFYPEICIFVGLFQLIIGSFGVARRFGVLASGNFEGTFQYLCGLLWILMLSLQNLVQNGYGIGGDLVARAPTLACFYFPLALMPAFLDFKMNSLPEKFSCDYYSSKGGQASVKPNLQNGTDEAV